MSDRARCQRKDRGNLLMMALLAMTSIMIVALGVSALVINALKGASTQGFSTDALFAAESGAEAMLDLYAQDWYPALQGCSVNQYVNISTATCQPNESVVTLSSGATFSIRYVQATPVKFRSRGEFLGHTRSIMLTLND